MRPIIVLLAGALILTACGQTRGERTFTGAGIGAAAGAIGADIIGGSISGGALLGGIVGATVGAATTDKRFHRHKGHRKYRKRYRYY